MLHKMIINRHDLVLIPKRHGLVSCLGVECNTHQDIQMRQKRKRRGDGVSSAQADDQPLAREIEDDYDLLTFGEAGARLDHEIRALRAQVEEIEQRQPPDQGELAAARARLSALRDAAARNARQPITDENFTKFFGYEGRARRNTK
jgi:hypothetical protein